VTPEQLQTELAKATVRPAYLIVGEEALYREVCVAAIEATLFPEGRIDFDYERLDGANANGAALENAVRTLPVVSPRRLVVLREPEPTRGRDKGLGDAIGAYVESSSDSADIVLVVVAAKVDGRARWVKAIGPKASVRCDPPKGARAIEAFIRTEAERQGIALGKGAASLLAERVGPNLLMLRQEIAKAALFAGPGEKVTSRHVAESTADVAEEPIWDLTDAIGDGRIADAISVSGRLVAAGGAPPAILASLATHFRKLLAMRTGGKVAGAPFSVRKLEQQSARFSAGRLISCMRAIHETDLALKGAGGIPANIALERLVIGLVGTPRR